MDLLKPFLIQQQHKSSLVLVVVVCYFVRDYFSKSFLFCFCFFGWLRKIFIRKIVRSCSGCLCLLDTKTDALKTKENLVSTWTWDKVTFHVVDKTIFIAAYYMRIWLKIYSFPEYASAHLSRSFFCLFVSLLWFIGFVLFLWFLGKFYKFYSSLLEFLI